MAHFDFHRRRMQARLRVCGSDPGCARALLKRWRAAAGLGGGVETGVLRLPVLPLAELAGFDLEPEAETEASARTRGADPDVRLVVLGPGSRGSDDVFLLKRRLAAEECRGPLLWASVGGWEGDLAETARALGIGDDVVRGRVDSRQGALACLEVALACVAEQALERIWPAAAQEAAPRPIDTARRVRAWARGLGRLPEAPPARPGRGAAGARPAAVPADEPWRRRALQLERIEPLPADDAAREIHALERILRFTPALLAARSEVDDGHG